VLLPCQPTKLAKGAEDKEHAMPEKLDNTIAVIGIDIGTLSVVQPAGPLSVIVMTHPYINDPKYWRERGEEARSIAQLLDDPKAKREMLAIAASYDRLADHVKQQRRKSKNRIVLRRSP